MLDVTARVAGHMGGLYKVEGEVTADGQTGGERIDHARGTPVTVVTRCRCRRGRLARRFFQNLRLEYPGPNRDAAAIGVGAFIGCLPFFGFHLLLTIMVGRVLRLNRLKMYAAANMSNPVMAPFLLFAEVQTGAWLRRRDAHDLTVEAIRQIDPWSLGGDLLLGSVCVGAVIGTLLTLCTLAAIRPARAAAAGARRGIRGGGGSLYRDHHHGVGIRARQAARRRRLRGAVQRHPAVGRHASSTSAAVRGSPSRR